MTMVPNGAVAALILAAGSFSDGGAPLALGKWGTTTVVEHLAGLIPETIKVAVVVLGCDGDDVADAVDLGDALVVIDPEWKEGIASPLRAGLDTLSRDPSIEHVLIIDATTPDVDERLLEDLLDAHAGTPHAIQGRRLGDLSATVPKFRYTRSNPVVLARDLWERFLVAEGSAQIVQVLSAHPEWVNELWIDRLPPAEVHTFDDLARVAPRH
jgi:CTP:molybdopterin cytidylyltransferase MocA